MRRFRQLPYIQQIELDAYRDCKRRSRKDHGLPEARSADAADETLIRLILENTSITDHSDTLHSFDNASKLIRGVCRLLCPGPWCDKGHCKHHSTHCAYHCGAGLRPSVCKEYKEYVKKKAEREAAKKKESGNE